MHPEMQKAAFCMSKGMPYETYKKMSRVKRHAFYILLREQEGDLIFDVDHMDWVKRPSQ